MLRTSSNRRAADVKRAVANVNGFLEDRSNFALFKRMGTPMVEAMLPKVIDSGVPFVATFSGALSIRPKNVRNVFNIRASYADEAEQLVQHLAPVGTSGHQAHSRHLPK